MSSPNNIVRCHSNKIIDSTLLQECISEAAICSKCKSSKNRLELWQDHTKRCRLDECYLQNVQNVAILFDCSQLRNVKIVFQKSIFDR